MEVLGYIFLVIIIIVVINSLKAKPQPRYNYVTPNKQESVLRELKIPSKQVIIIETLGFMSPDIYITRSENEFKKHLRDITGWYIYEGNCVFNNVIKASLIDESLEKLKKNLIINLRLAFEYSEYPYRHTIVDQTQLYNDIATELHKLAIQRKQTIN